MKIIPRIYLHHSVDPKMEDLPASGQRPTPTSISQRPTADARWASASGRRLLANGLISKTKVMNETGDDKSHLVKIMKSEGEILSTLKIDDKTNLIKPMKTVKKKKVKDKKVQEDLKEDIPNTILEMEELEKQSLM